jgi:protein TonB
VQELEKKNTAQVGTKTAAEQALEFASMGAAKQGEKTEGSKPQTEGLLMPSAPEKKEAARPVVGMALPIGKSASSEAAQGTKDPSEELLPKPELDFSKIPVAAQAEGVALGSQQRARTVSIKKVLVPLLGVLVVVVAWSVWYGKMWTYVPLGKNTTVAVGPTRAAKPGAAGQAGNALGSAGVPGSVKAKGTATASGGAEAAGEKHVNAAPAAENGEGSAAEESKAKSAESEGARQPVAAKEKPGKKGAADARSAAGGNAAEIATGDAGVQPAKLLKAATPVYPPNAMRGFITGDVKVEAVVEADGHVGEVKVISGPRALREAAVEALKKYQFAPARQGGKAVASKVTETVKFWFNP